MDRRRTFDSKEPNYCDAVIILTQAGQRQELFDAAEPGTTNDPALVVSCDEPHFTVHWAGDLDRDGRLDMLVTFSHQFQLPSPTVVSFIGRAVRQLRRGSGALRAVR